MKSITKKILEKADIETTVTFSKEELKNIIHAELKRMVKKKSPFVAKVRLPLYKKQVEIDVNNLSVIITQEIMLP